MIHLLYGENNFFVRQKMQEILSSWPVDVQIERYDGADVTAESLPAILQTLSLFSTQKYIVFKDLSLNKSAWAEFAEQLDAALESEMILLEETVDKRTKTFKKLQKIATVFEAKPLSESEAAAWLGEQASARSVVLTKSQIHTIIERIGCDAWQLHFALEKLGAAGKVTDEIIDELLEPTAHDTVFGLLDAAFSGKVAETQALVSHIKSEQDPYQFFGLFSQQIFQLVTLAVSEQSPAVVAKELGVHPYPLQKLQPFARTLSTEHIKNIVTLLGQCDDELKRSGVEPWLLIEQALVKLALIRQKN